MYNIVQIPAVQEDLALKTTKIEKKNGNFKDYFIFSLIFLVVNTIIYYRMPIRIWQDTATYLAPLNYNILSLDFLLSDRPIIYPLILKIFNKNFFIVTLFQFFFFTFSVIFFSFSFSKLFNTRFIQRLSLGILCFLFLGSAFSQWQKIMLTESVTISFYLTFVGIVIYCMRTRFSIFLSILAFLMLMCFGFTRDSNIYFVIFLIPVIAFYSLFSKNKNSIIFAVFYLLLSFAMLFYANLSVSKGYHRWSDVMVLITNKRLNCQNNQSAVHELDLPKSLHGTRQRQFELFNQYKRYLIMHPYYTWIMPLTDISIYHEFSQCVNVLNLINYENISASILHGFSTLYNRVPIITNYMSSLFSYIFIGLVFFPIFILMAIPKKNIKKVFCKNIFLILFCAFNTFLYAFIVWHGDGDIPRHLNMAVLQLTLSFLYIGLVICEKIQLL